MRILEAVSTRGASGAVRYAARLIPELQKRGHEVILAALPGSWLVDHCRGRCELLETGFERWPLGELKRMARFCRDRQIDLVHSHLTRANNFSALLRTFHGIRNVAHAHENKPHPHYWFHDLVVGVSSFTLRRHRRYGAGLGRKGRVLHNFVDTELFQPAPAGTADLLCSELGLSRGTPVIVQVGDIGPRKGHSVTLAAMPLVWERFPGAHVAFIGEGSLSTTDPRFHWLGKREDVPRLLPHASLALLPSVVEPFGLAAIEAMACGLPLVASAVDGLNEVVRPDTAVKVPPRSPRDVADAICRLLGSPETGRAMGTRAREEVLQRFSVAAHVDRVLDIFAAVSRT